MVVLQKSTQKFYGSSPKEYSHFSSHSTMGKLLKTCVIIAWWLAGVTLIPFILPFAVEGSVCFLVLAVLFPFAWVTSRLERNVLLAFTLIFLFLQFCALADVVADLIFLGNALVLLFKDIGEFFEGKEPLFLSRIIFTVVGSTGCLIFSWLILVGLDTPKPKNATEDEKGGSVQEAPKKKVKKKKLLHHCVCFIRSLKFGGIFLVILLAILWKVIVLGLRTTLVVFAGWSVLEKLGCTSKNIPHKIKRYLETVLMCDLAFTALPSTAILLASFAYHHVVPEELSEPTEIFELVKLGGFTFDCIVTSYFVFYEFIPIYVYREVPKHEYHVHVPSDSVISDDEPLIQNRELEESIV